MSFSITKMKDSIHQFEDARFNDCRIVALKDHLYSELKDEGVVLSLKNGKYYGLNEVGRTIWQIIQSPVRLEEIQTAIMQDYEVDEETCRKEVLAFLNQMAGEELLEISDEKGF